METMDYFTSVGTKSSIKSKEEYSAEGSRPDLMVKYLKEHDVLEKNMQEIDAMYAEWFDRMFAFKFNIVVRGLGSKFRLLETFSQRYLMSDYISSKDDQPVGKKQARTDKRESARKKSAVLPLEVGLTTYRLHGFYRNSLDHFIHSVLGIITKRKHTKADIARFIENLEETNVHCVFLIHSFDKLYKDCKPVCDLIFDLYESSPQYIHLLLSCDHINSGKILSNLGSQLKLCHYDVPYGESFFYEKMHTISVMGDNENENVIGQFDGEINLQSLKDVHQALQKACQTILVYILNDFIERNNFKENLIEQPDSNKSKSKGNKSRRSTRANPQAPDPHLNYQVLMSHCESKFIVRRANQLNNYLEELADHRIVELDSTRHKIQCLVPLSTCKKFLEYVGST